jgi:hypothetical protein
MNNIKSFIKLYSTHDKFIFINFIRLRRISYLSQIDEFYGWTKEVSSGNNHIGIL